MRVEQQLLAAVGSTRGAAAADRLCEACVDLFGVDDAALSLVFDGVNTGTLGANSTRARDYDELQFLLGEGPCLSSVEQRAAVLVPDLDHDGHEWPQYTAALLGMDVHAVFAMPVLAAGEYVGALDLFVNRRGALTGDVLAGMLTAARLAELPLLDLVRETVPEAAADPGGRAWAELNALTRLEVSRATGMLVGQLDVDPVVALVRLRAHAFATGRSPTAVARDILERRLVLDRDDDRT